MILIKIFPANNGDSFLINLHNKFILIDGGYVNTYNNFIKPELKEIAKIGNSLSHIIVTHIDGDHISGIIKLLEDNLKEKYLTIGNIWHNSYRHIKNIQFHNPFYDLKNGKKIDTLEINSYLKVESSSEKDISAEQGSKLGALILKTGCAWNYEFEGNSVSTDVKDIIHISNDIKILLLSPNDKKLDDLKKYWQKELFKAGYMNVSESEMYDDAFEFLIAMDKKMKVYREKPISSTHLDIEALTILDFAEDYTPSNGSSISFIMEYKNYKFLFLGDSHPSVIVENLKKQYFGKQFPIKFDLIKVSHHGSIGNTSKQLLSLIDSEKYIFSTNGKISNHPDIETIARIISRKVDFKRTLYFNYPLDIHKQINTTEVMNKYNFENIINDGNSPSEIQFE